MATVIIRPDGEESSTGFDVSGATLVDRINDNNTGTGATQNSTTADFTVTMDEGSDAYAGATINSIKLSVNAVAGRSGTSVCTCQILNGTASDAVLQEDDLTFSSDQETLDGTTYSTSLTETIVDGLKVKIGPDSAGVTIFEVFITVDYTAAAAVTTPFVGMKSGKYKIVSGKIKI